MIIINYFYNYHCLFCHSVCRCSFCASAGRKQVETISCLSTIFINYLLINKAKTQTLPIGPCKYDFDLTLNGSGVTKLPSIRILGVELCTVLNFIEHISNQLKKKGLCEDRRCALRRIRRFVPKDVMLASCNSFILPHLEYSSPLLLGVGKVQANNIEDANRYILRALTGHGKSLSYQYLQVGHFRV